MATKTSGGTATATKAPTDPKLGGKKKNKNKTGGKGNKSKP
jgi:hypothetical protein